MTKPGGSAEAMLEVLERARAAGFLGPGIVEPHLTHSGGFGVAAEDALGRPPRNFVDLGTGGGIPGLVEALRWPGASGIFVEAGRRRAAFLRDAVSELGLEDRVEVLEQRAEAVGGSGPYREQFELVTARSFAPPPVTAEIATGLLAVGGVLVVSEPPELDPGRWPLERLEELGLGEAELVEVGAAHFVVVRKKFDAATRYPRRTGVASKRPLW